MNTPNKVLLAFLIFGSIFACNRSSFDRWPMPSSEKTPVPLQIQRYGKALFALDTNQFLQELSVIQPQFKAFIGDNYDDPNQLGQLYSFVTDTQLIQLNKKTQEVFPDLKALESELSQAFARFHYFFPSQPLPELYSYVSGLHYESPVEKHQNLMIIALDMYLGEDFETYKYLGLPQYRIRKMAPDYIAQDVMKSLYDSDLNPKFKQKTMLDRMIGAGKMMVYLDAVLPETPDSIKMGYTSRQWNWMEENKASVWAYLIKNNLFYSSNYDIQTKLIQDAPFTTGFSNESAPRVGVWLGWQIVRAYHENNPEIPLADIINNPDVQEILQKSGYKP